MAANSQNYGSLPEIVPTSAPKTSKRRAIASVAVAVMMFAAGAAALNSKTTATAPAALVEYDGSGVTSQVSLYNLMIDASQALRPQAPMPSGGTRSWQVTLRRLRLIDHVLGERRRDCRETKQLVTCKTLANIYRHTKTNPAPVPT